MLPAEVRRYVQLMKGRLPPSVRVAFHGHNNLMLALGNCVAALEAGATVLDSTMHGVGRSAGNAASEVLVMVLGPVGILTGCGLRTGRWTPPIWSFGDARACGLRGECARPDDGVCAIPLQLPWPSSPGGGGVGDRPAPAAHRGQQTRPCQPLGKAHHGTRCPSQPAASGRSSRRLTTAGSSSLPAKARMPADLEEVAVDPVKVFEAEKRENIQRLGGDGGLKELSRRFLHDTGKYRYTYNFTWLGRPVIQFPQDLLALQEIVWSVRLRPSSSRRESPTAAPSIFHASMPGTAGRGWSSARHRHRHPPSQSDGDRAAPPGQAVSHMIEGSSIDPGRSSRRCAAVPPANGP